MFYVNPVIIFFLNYEIYGKKVITDLF